MDKLKTESELIRQAREGDLDAFTALVHKHEKRAIHIAYAFLGNFEDACDMAQEAFVKVYENLNRFKGQSLFSTWLYRIVANRCKDFLRKENLRKWGLWIPRDRNRNKRSLADQPVTRKKALKDLLDQELGAQIHEALEKLPLRQKSVFILRYLEGMRMEEIAQTENLTTGAVKAHLWQAGQKMKKSLGSYRTERGDVS